MPNQHTVVVLFVVLMLSLSTVLWMFYPHLRTAFPEPARTVLPSIDTSPHVNADREPLSSAATSTTHDAIEAQHVRENGRHFFIGRITVEDECTDLRTMTTLSSDRQSALLLFSTTEPTTPCRTNTNKQKPYTFSFEAPHTVSVQALINGVSIPLRVTNRTGLPPRW
jgi:hypothetical protein